MHGYLELPTEHCGIRNEVQVVDAVSAVTVARISGNDHIFLIGVICLNVKANGVLPPPQQDEYVGRHVHQVTGVRTQPWQHFAGG